MGEAWQCHPSNHCMAVPADMSARYPALGGTETMQIVRWDDPSLWLLIAVLVPELPYLAPDHFCHVRLNKHVGRIKHVHDEPL